MDKLIVATYEELRMIEDVGEITADTIYEFFRQEQTIDLINKLKQANVNMKAEIQENEDGKFAGKTFVLTGSLEHYSREEASEIIEKWEENLIISIKENRLCSSRRRCGK